ncbi:MAG: F0F1 ATP synthase subunit C [Elusimicrobia bacterium]|nr:F0F1 ATP synthase subunit C [Elusimicrobiota bacterium]
MNEQLYLGLGYLGAGLGAGMVVIGATLAIAKAVAAAVEGTARQPEADAKIKSNMQLFIFLIEGLGIIGLGVTYVIALNLGLKAIPTSATAAPPAATAQAHH